MSASENHSKAFTPRQAEVYDELPNTRAGVADALGISESTARDHLTALINECGVPISEDEHGILYDRAQSGESVNATAPPSAPPIEDSSVAQHTIKKKEVLLEMRRTLAKELTNLGPVVADGGIKTEPSNEDIVWHRSDDHMGAEYTGEFGNLSFNPDIGLNRIEKVSRKGIELMHRQMEAGVEFDNGHVLMGGDHVHGEGIHRDQPWESAMTLVDQIETVHDAYIKFIAEIRHELDTVQVVCQRGNHGELRGDGMSADANADDIVYMMMEKTIHNKGWDNVTLIRSAGAYFTNFTMRGHRGHLRHGQKSLYHIGTSSGENRWRGWRNMHGHFDIAYRGHYHTFKIESIDSCPVIMSGSICPPADFEESLAVWDEPAATVHGVSDSRPMTWFYPIDFAEDDGVLPTSVAT